MSTSRAALLTAIALVGLTQAASAQALPASAATGIMEVARDTSIAPNGTSANVRIAQPRQPSSFAGAWAMGTIGSMAGTVAGAFMAWDSDSLGGAVLAVGTGSTLAAGLLAGAVNHRAGPSLGGAAVGFLGSMLTWAIASNVSDSGGVILLSGAAVQGLMAAAVGAAAR
jgi:hypothetical protein